MDGRSDQEAGIWVTDLGPRKKGGMVMLERSPFTLERRDKRDFITLASGVVSEGIVGVRVMRLYGLVLLYHDR